MAKHERIALPESIPHSTIVEAIRLFDEGKSHHFAPSTDYDVLYGDRRYPPKAIVGIASEILTGHVYRPRDFSAGVDSKCFRLLEDAGFMVVAKHPSDPYAPVDFKAGQTYNRQADIHKVFGGQQRGGISTPSGCPFIFLFTGQGGDSFGYKDEFRPDGSFWYTGEGQIGDMALTRGNLAIADHERNGKRLLLFSVPSKGHAKYIGEARMVQFHTEPRPDGEGNMREAIVFELEILSDAAAPAKPEEETKPYSEGRLWSINQEMLKEIASRPASRTLGKIQQKQVVHQRSEAVRIYVLRRAKGICELCGKSAPFTTHKNKPYLEPHHLTRLADGGPDHPAHVAACCPNCHREVHFGKDGDALNEKLRKKIALLEDEQSI